MIKYLLFVTIALCFLTTASFSQTKIKGSVKGTLVDTVGGSQVLGNATVALTPAKGDSTDTDFIITDKKGTFAFKGLDSGVYRLEISYQGYAPIRRTITIDAATPDHDLAVLYMSRSNDMMEAVVVQRPPISIKKDTVEYTAGMFATKPNAVAEDLLKKMPGIQVDKSGTVTAQGETVSRVLVNGKRFFSDDPKMATRNLPPDIIDKIQVFDDLSDQSKFTGFDDGNRVKTINIVTKKDKRQGYFGKAVAGAGTNENYDASVNMHRFDGEQQISVLGQANDINKQNFSQADIFGSGGGRRGGGGGFGGGGGGGSSGGSGITTVWAGGANYRNALSPKTDLTASYFFNQQHVSVAQSDSVIKPINTDTTQTSAGGNYSLSRSENHRIFMNLEERFDSSNSLVFRPNVTFQHSSPTATSSSYAVDNFGNPINRSVSRNNSYTHGFNINGTNLQLRHKFKKPFRTMSLDLNVSSNVNNGTGFNNAVNTLYKLGEVDTLNQYYVNSYHGTTLSPTLSYTEPIAKDQILEFNYNHSYTNNKTLNNTFDFSDSTHSYSRFDSLFSNSYKFVSNSDRFTLNYRIQNIKYNFSAGSGIQFTHYNSDNLTKGITVARNYVNLTPTMNFQYLWSRTSHLRVNYSGRTGQPSASQLQPLTTTGDQISYTVGNPDLKPQFTHSLRVLYTNFQPANQRVLFATVNASTTVNDIQSLFWYNAKGGQTTTYVNLGGTWNVSGYFNYGFPLKKPKSNVNFITNINYSQSQSLWAQDSLAALSHEVQHLFVHNTTMTETVSWTTNIKKNFDMNFSSATTYNIARRQSAIIAKNAGGENNNNLNYFTEVLSAEITAYTNSGWLIATSFDYTYTNNHSSGYNASVPLLNPSIAKQLFKKKNGELRLTVFDLLNQNVSVTKSVGNTGQITYNRTNVLTRYAMLTFTYNLNNFAGSNQRRMPGFFPGRRGGGGFHDGGGGGFRGGPPE
ncbi:TonB-dependent receptor [Flavitalea sp. BT771]|uniref:TonB-dependent receptor n=1 Tax=Flavitalea sp. BT771 TaxID=3063329 RepID=UPI0026E2DD32|nr:TonB-dependent receptor [Flavitalea sp. BT771]MDO6434430.1 TonB-dependent receptor [Flavitalea sp. BT771]MDV6223330.1 TonB-dependent receptor [Flavitalea sp. BT771]